MFGFNPELSGRENVYLNGALLGFTRNEIDLMYDEIVEFAELAKFMDQKLKNLFFWYAGQASVFCSHPSRG